MVQNVGAITYTVDVKTKAAVSAANTIVKANTDMQKGFSKTDNEIKKTNRSLGKLKALAVAVAAVITAGKVQTYADAWTNAQSQIRVVTKTTEELTEATRGLLLVANQTRSDFGSTVTLYARLARTTKSLKVSQEQLLAITKVVNQQFLINGSTTAEASSAIIQFTQALQRGTLRGEEFNSITEAAPGILKAVAKEMGVSEDALRALAEQGKITRIVLVNALLGVIKETESEFKKLSPTIEQSFTVAKNNFMDFIGAIDEQTGASGVISKFIIKVSELPQKTLELIGQVSKNINSFFSLIAVSGEIAFLDVEKSIQQFSLDSLQTLSAWAVSAASIVDSVAAFTGIDLSGSVEEFTASRVSAITAQISDIDAKIAKLEERSKGLSGTVFPGAEPAAEDEEIPELRIVAPQLSELEKLTQGIMEGLKNLTEAAQEPAIALGQSWGKALDSVSTKMGNTLGRAIVMGDSLRDSVKEVAQSFLIDMVGALIKVGVQMLINAAIGNTATTTATTVSAASAAAVSTAWATPAALVNAATFGAGAAAGTPAVAASVAAVNAMSLASGRQMGGPVEQGKLFPVGEGGKSEILRENGKQFLIPGNRGSVISNNDLNEGGNAINVDIIVNNSATGAIGSASTRQDGDTLTVDILVRDLDSGNGPISQAMTRNIDADRINR